MFTKDKESFVQGKTMIARPGPKSRSYHVLGTISGASTESKNEVNTNASPNEALTLKSLGLGAGWVGGNLIRSEKRYAMYKRDKGL